MFLLFLNAWEPLISEIKTKIKHQSKTSSPDVLEFRYFMIFKGQQVSKYFFAQTIVHSIKVEEKNAESYPLPQCAK